MSNTTHNGLLTTTAIVSAAYAVAMLVAPGTTLGVFDLSDNPSTVWMARLLGASSLGFAAIAFLARRIDDMDARRAVDGGFLVATTATVGITMWAQYLQVTNALGWINVAVFGALAVAFFYFIAGEDRFGEALHGRPA